MPRIDFNRALVTGGAGFIGSHIAERLKATGMDVSVIDDLSMGTESYLPGGVAFFHGSVLDSSLLKKALDGVDIVFHNAARVSIRNSFDDLFGDTQTNVLGTANLLKEAGRAGIKKFIFASSMAVYGGPSDLPVKKERFAPDPASPYGTGKLAGEIYTRQLAEFYGFESAALRYFNTFGPRQTLTPYVGVITIFINKLLRGEPPVIFGTGSQVRDYIYAGDVAEANLLAMKASLNGEVINIGTGTGTSVEKIARLLIERMAPGLSPLYAPAPLGEPADSVADIKKARELLGFNPKTRLEDKLGEIIEWNSFVSRRHCRDAACPRVVLK